MITLDASHQTQTRGNTNDSFCIIYIYLAVLGVSFEAVHGEIDSSRLSVFSRCDFKFVYSFVFEVCRRDLIRDFFVGHTSNTGIIGRRRKPFLFETLALLKMG